MKKKNNLDKSSNLNQIYMLCHDPITYITNHLSETDEVRFDHSLTLANK